MGVLHIRLNRFLYPPDEMEVMFIEHIKFFASVPSLEERYDYVIGREQRPSLVLTGPGKASVADKSTRGNDSETGMEKVNGIIRRQKHHASGILQ